MDFFDLYIEDLPILHRIRMNQSPLCVHPSIGDPPKLDLQGMFVGLSSDSAAVFQRGAAFQRGAS